MIRNRRLWGVGLLVLCVVGVLYQGYVFSVSQGVLRERLHTLEVLEAAPMGVIVCDRDLRVVSFNKAAEDLFGVSRSEVLGLSPSVLLPAGFGVEHERLMRSGVARVGGDGVVKCGLPFVITRDNIRVPVVVSIRRVCVGGVVEFVAFVTPGVCAL